MTAPRPCRELDERATDLVEDILPVYDRRRLRAHLAACPRCAATLHEYGETVAALGDLRVRGVDGETRRRLLGVFRVWRDGHAPP